MSVIFETFDVLSALTNEKFGGHRNPFPFGTAINGN